MTKPRKTWKPLWCATGSELAGETGNPGTRGAQGSTRRKHPGYRGHSEEVRAGLRGLMEMADSVREWGDEMILQASLQAGH